MRTIIVPVSGGKDSQVVLSLALSESRKTGRPVVCVHQNTGFDHPLTYWQIESMEFFYKVQIEHTVNKWGGMFGFLEQAGYFPNSAARGCTQRLKQEPFSAWLTDKGFTSKNCEIWFGMRSDESKSRGDKYGQLDVDDEFELGLISDFYRKLKNKEIGRIPCKLPIVNWTEDQVFAHIRAEGAPLNDLYARGHHRVGCYPCLLSRKAEWQAASSDSTGRDHLGRMIALEDKWASDGNHRKFIKVHRTWDVRKFLCDGAASLPEAGDECGYCSI